VKDSWDVLTAKERSVSIQQSPDMNCDVCSEPIVGPVYFRGDVVCCKACAHAINSNNPDAWPNVYFPILLWPVATALGLVVLYVEMVPFIMLLLGAVAIFLFVLGAMKAVG
jgi:hypothetical protein